MTVKKIKLGNKYKVTLETTYLSGADKLGLKLGDEIDAGDGRFLINEVGRLQLIPELVKAGTSGVVACTRHLTKSGKHELQVGDTITVKEGLVVRDYDISCTEGWLHFNDSMTAMCGKDFVIESVKPSGTYSLEGVSWNWANEWLTFKSPAPYVAPVETIEVTKESLTPKQLLKQRQQTFKVGDRVVLVGGVLGETTLDGSARYCKDKQKHQGKVMIIKSIWGGDCDITVYGEDGSHVGWVSPDWIVKETEYKDAKYSHYFKDVSHLDTIDVYQVLSLFNVTNPCLQHIVKKALVTGGRTAGKDFSQDLREIRDTAIRAVEMDEQSKS